MLKHLLIASCAIAITPAAHAVGMTRGGNGPGGTPGSTASGFAAAQSAHTGAAMTSGNTGGRYSVVDGYQPWPESEMRQYQKAHWTPYMGD